MAHPVNQAEVGIWSQVKNAVVDSANWLGRKVVVFGNAIADFTMKVVDFVKPFFAAIGRYVSNAYEISKEWLVEHKQGVAIGAGLVALGAVLFAIFSTLFCDESENTTPAPAPKTP